MHKILDDFYGFSVLLQVM